MSDSMSKLIVSSSPHAHSGASVRRIMIDVVIALVPAFLAAFVFFGWNALRLVVVCSLSSVATEAVCRKMMGRDLGIGDWSAVVTGVLLAFNLPPTLPTWMAIVGSVFAIAIAKQLFGGLGYNPFNPALVARVALLVSFPVPMTRWHDALHAQRWHALAWSDATTSATPLGLVKTALSSGQSLPIDFNCATALEYFVGRMGGCIGEVSALALILGGGYLLVRRVITWHVPAFYIGTVAVLSSILRVADGGQNMMPVFHLLSGGLMLGAFFMATDMVTTPVTRKGQAVFGIGCGILTMVIRKWGGYPEGVSFAILLMNSVTPLINRATRPRMFGRARKS